jgi:hypothetical protein
MKNAPSKRIGARATNEALSCQARAARFILKREDERWRVAGVGFCSNLSMPFVDDACKIKIPLR